MSKEKQYAAAALDSSEKAMKKAKNADLEVVNVKSYGAFGDSKNHPLSSMYSSLAAAQVDYPVATALTDEADWCAIQRAMNIARDQTFDLTRGGTIYIPAGRYMLNKPLSSENISAYGDMQATTLKFTELGAGVAAWTILRSYGKRFYFSDINLAGPGTYALGQKTAECNGIKVTGTAMPLFNNMTINHFNCGMDFDNEAGHIKLIHCHVERNYYGIYWSRNTGDYSIFYSSVNENNFANLVANATWGIEGLSIRDSHIGYAPYGFYCEPAPGAGGGKNTFLLDLNLDHARFEQIGNAAIYSDPSQGSNPRVTTMKIKNPGFSWDKDKAKKYELTDRPREYAIDIGQVIDGDIVIESDSYPFTAGTVNTIRVRNQTAPAQITLIGKSMSSDIITVAGGTAKVQAGSNVQVMQNGIDERTLRRLTRSDRPGDLWEEDITQDGTGTQYRLSHIKDGTRTEVYTVSTGNDMRIKRPVLLDQMFSPARLSAAPANPREGSMYIDSSNTGYECVRTYLGARWTRQGSASAMPTTGSWQRGDYILNSLPAIASGVVVKGWFRVTTGTTNVLGTDWVEERITVTV